MENNGNVDCIYLQQFGRGEPGTIFSMKKDMPFGYLIDIYCAAMGLEKSAVEFRFKGKYIKEEDTPLSLQMNVHEFIFIYKK